MSGPCQNEINMVGREMHMSQKSYYEQPQGYAPGFYQPLNGYGAYDSMVGYGGGGGGGSGGGLGDNYGPRSSCVMQGAPPGMQHPGVVGNCPPMEYSPHQYANSCMQTIDLTGCNNISPGGTPGGLPPNPQSLKSHNPPAEIYPWMRESRQNSKQRQHHSPQHPQQSPQITNTNGE